MAIDKLINSTQGDSIIAALNAISSKVGSPYNLENKLNPAYINYDSTHAATPETVATSGITSTDVAQIETNKNNILTVANQSTQYNLLFYNLSTLKSYNSNNAIWNENVCTIGNISFTINDDMSITVSGNSDNNSVYFLLARDISFPAIRFQGCPAGGGTNTYQLQAYYSSTSSASLNDNGSGASAEANSWSEIDITIRPNQTISDPITFFPTVIPQSLYDSGFHDYQPYALSNVELTAKERVNEKNILTVANQSTKYNLSPVASGTTSGAGFIIDNTAANIPQGDYYFCWTGTTDTYGTTINIYINKMVPELLISWNLIRQVK